MGAKHLFVIIIILLNQLCFSQQTGSIKIFSIPNKLCIEGKITEEIVRDTTNSFVTHIKLSDEVLISNFLTASSILNCYSVSNDYRNKSPKIIIDYELTSNLKPNSQVNGTIFLYPGYLVNQKGIFFRNFELHRYIEKILNQSKE
ncbi:MAG: hypothetical protein IPN33_08105 [Saprospiraceae bacterium]|nr:hypothetical protein [Saprospiraceae bacterium]